MGTYIVRRLLHTVFVVWATLTLLFLAFAVMGENAIDLKGGERAVAESVKDELSERYGLNDPLVVQYKDYWQRMFRWDLGESYIDGSSVNEKLRDGIKTSGRLAFWGAVVQGVAGIGVGLIAAARRYKPSDNVITFLTIAVTGVPVFVSGLLVQYFLGVVPNQRGWPSWAKFPVQGFGPDTWVLGLIPTGHTWKYIVLPAIILASVETAFMARIMRSSLLEVLRADYMRTAAAKGLRRSTVLLKHGLRNALIPVVTVYGLSIVTMFGVAVLTEAVFSLAGLGSQIQQAAQARDSPVVLGMTSVVVLAGALMTLLVDLSYGLIDPRVRVNEKGAGR